jgi:hypothetical protein
MNSIAVLSQDGPEFEIKAIFGAECAGGTDAQQLFQMILDDRDRLLARISEEKRHSIELEQSLEQAHALIALLEEKVRSRA